MVIESITNSLINLDKLLLNNICKDLNILNEDLSKKEALNFITDIINTLKSDGLKFLNMIVEDSCVCYNDKPL
jgi:hypothetical protein